MRKVKITTYNTHLFLNTAGGFAPEYEDEERLNKLIWQLLKSQSDIVSLNEVWADSSKEKLVKGLVSKFPYSYYPKTKESPIKLGSGLLVLSKFKIIDPSFTQFTDLVGSDDWSQKGFIWVKLMIDSSTPIYFIATHTQSGESTAEVNARWSNFKQIFAAINASGIVDNTPLFVAGDLNVIGEYKGGAATSEYTKVKNSFLSLGLVDAYRTLKPQANIDHGFSYNGFKNKLIPIFAPRDSNVQQRLDYIFSNNTKLSIAINSADIVTNYMYSDPKTPGLMDLSDHYPLTADFS
jgi:exonuclease III